MIKDAFYRKRFKETPSVRSVKVIWHFGEPGSGKTYTYKQLVDEYGEDNVYFITDYENGGFDFYNGQAILCLDEFRGQFKFSFLLNILDVYKSQIHCRYSNCFSLWNEVHIFSVLPPEKVYEKMVSENREIDNFGQLLRRLDFLVYHWKDGKGYHKFELSKEKYVDYEDLKLRALFPENYRAPIEPHIVDEVEVPF